MYVFVLLCFASSGVKSKDGEYALVLGYDGSLKIYGPSIWTAHNKVKESYHHLEPSEGSNIPVTDSTLCSGDIAPIGTIIVKDKYKLELGWTCNMTLTNTKSGRVLWHMNNTDITRYYFVNLDGDGQLKVKYLGGATLWANDAASDWGQDYVLAPPSNQETEIPLTRFCLQTPPSNHHPPSTFNTSTTRNHHQPT